VGTMDITQSVWLVTVLLTGTAAGAMVGHTLLLGRFLNWLLVRKGPEAFRETYPAFIRERSPQVFFDNLFTLTIVVTTAFNAYLYLSGRLAALSLLAAGLQWAFVAAFFGTGFAKVEAELFKKGNTSPELVGRFVARNLPLCALSSILLLASFACLLLTRLP
jgi:hypothetical protein